MPLAASFTPRLWCAQVDIIAEYVAEEQLIERPGFFLTTLQVSTGCAVTICALKPLTPPASPFFFPRHWQAATMYAISADAIARLACGHCEVLRAGVAAAAPPPPPVVVCAECGRQLCGPCDRLIHSAARRTPAAAAVGAPPLALHSRSPAAVARAESAQPPESAAASAPPPPPLERARSQTVGSRAEGRGTIYSAS